MSQLIKELLQELKGSDNQTGEKAYNIHCDVEYYDNTVGEYIQGEISQLPFKIVQVNDYDQHVRDAMGDCYDSVPISIVIEYKGLFLRSEAQMGSYVDGWEEWKLVTPKQITTTIYE